MISIENDVINYVGNKVRAAHEGADVAGTYVNAPSTFPHVSIVEADNRVFDRMRTIKIENAAVSLIEINIYSNKASGKKQEAIAIANTVDEGMEEIGYTRTFRNPIPNLNDASIYRIVCRYEAIIGRGSDGKFLVYQSNYI